MRLGLFVSAAVMLLAPSASLGQEWIHYVSREDRFTVNFPRQPDIRNIDYETEFGLKLPARVHSVAGVTGRYAVTVVDYTNVQAIHAARLKDCREADINLCTNPWNGEIRGAMDFAVWNSIKNAAKVTDYAYYNAERIEGRRIQLLNADGTRTFVAINMHDNRLYIIEGTVPANFPPPGLFQQSIGWVDKDGVRVRYDTTYANMYPPPPRVQYGPPAVKVPDLSGMQMGTTKTFTEGPFAGQTWGVDGSGRPYLVRVGQPTNEQGLP